MSHCWFHRGRLATLQGDARFPVLEVNSSFLKNKSMSSTAKSFNMTWVIWEWNAKCSFKKIGMQRDNPEGGLPARELSILQETSFLNSLVFFLKQRSSSQLSIPKIQISEMLNQSWDAKKEQQGSQRNSRKRFLSLQGHGLTHQQKTEKWTRKAEKTLQIKGTF